MQGVRLVIRPQLRERNPPFALEDFLPYAEHRVSIFVTGRRFDNYLHDISPKIVSGGEIKTAHCRLPTTPPPRPPPDFQHPPSRLQPPSWGRRSGLIWRPVGRGSEPQGGRGSGSG